MPPAAVSSCLPCPRPRLQCEGFACADDSCGVRTFVRVAPACPAGRRARSRCTAVRIGRRPGRPGVAAPRAPLTGSLSSAESRACAAWSLVPGLEGEVVQADAACGGKWLSPDGAPGAVSAPEQSTRMSAPMPPAAASQVRTDAVLAAAAGHASCRPERAPPPVAGVRSRVPEPRRSVQQQLVGLA